MLVSTLLYKCKLLQRILLKDGLPLAVSCKQDLQYVNVFWALTNNSSKGEEGLATFNVVKCLCPSSFDVHVLKTISKCLEQVVWGVTRGYCGLDLRDFERFCILSNYNKNGNL